MRVLDAEGLRPTPDRVRETLFNWLGQRLDGARCLDLFAGTGALGFEAASRGAARVLMVERHPKAAAQLRANRDKLSAGAVEVVEGDALRLSARLAPGTFDVVFLDPPFTTGLLGQALTVAAPLVTPAGALYVEAPDSLTRMIEAGALPSLLEWALTHEGKAGIVHYHLLRRRVEQTARAASELSGSHD